MVVTSFEHDATQWTALVSCGPAATVLQSVPKNFS